MHTDLSTKPDFASLSGQDLVRYNNAMVREILATGLTGYREVSVFQNKDAGIKRCEANWSSLVCGRANVAAEAKEQDAPKKPRALKIMVETVTANVPLGRAAVAGNKVATLQAMLTTGATVSDMCAALGWQAHTLRARISTSGLRVARIRTDGVTSYKLVS